MIRKVGLSLFVLSVLFFRPLSATFETSAEQAILIDYQTGVVLFEKNADVLMAPSSMTKILTAYVALRMIKEGRLKLTDTFVVSEKAWKMGGSRMFLDLNSHVSVKDLLLGIMVVSGNDACITLAEGIAGTEEAFVQMMNEVAHSIGAENVHFLNSNGWPDEGHECTARDLAIIAQHIISEFPDFYKEYFSQREFTYNNINQRNLNPLLDAGVGADGLKTGFTNKGKYGLTASAVDHNGRRLIMVINGTASSKVRKQEAIKLIQYGFRAFDTIQVAKKGETVDEADVWLGSENTVKLIATQPAYLTIRAHEKKNIKAEVIYDSPISAPIKAGQKVAELRVSGSNLMPPATIPLVAEKDIGKAGFLDRIRAAVYYLALGHNPVKKSDK